MICWLLTMRDNAYWMASVSLYQQSDLRDYFTKSSYELYKEQTDK